MSFSFHNLYMKSICPVTVDVNFDHLIKVLVFFLLYLVSSYERYFDYINTMIVKFLKKLCKSALRAN